MNKFNNNQPHSKDKKKRNNHLYVLEKYSFGIGIAIFTVTPAIANALGGGFSEQ